MRTPFVSRVLQVWFRLRYSYWFVPAVMMGLAVLLAAALIASDRLIGDADAGLPTWLYAGGPDGAREVLSVIAGSMITVAGVVFSITIVALQLASSQFGPRVLRNFMRDRGNQIVLGTFVATFVYSLLILRTIRTGEQETVPALAVSVAVVLAVSSLAVLIYFIHHAAMSVQASHIVSAIGKELFETIDRIYPEEAEGASSEPPTIDEAEAVPVHLRHTGYVQAVDLTLLTQLAAEHDLLIRLTCGPGSFISTETVVMRLWPRERCTESVVDDARDSVALGSIRTPEQDVLFAADQLVEVAMRSLSPGINDPFTAVSCIHWIGAAVIQILGRRRPSEHVRDDEGAVRLLIPTISLDEVLEHTFGRLRPYAEGHRVVLRTLVETLVLVRAYAQTERHRALINYHLRLVLAAAERSLGEVEDVRLIRDVAQLVDEETPS